MSGSFTTPEDERMFTLLAEPSVDNFNAQRTYQTCLINFRPISEVPNSYHEDYLNFSTSSQPSYHPYAHLSGQVPCYGAMAYNVGIVVFGMLAVAGVLTMVE